jgi:hypothetical protein
MGGKCLTIVSVYESHIRFTANSSHEYPGSILLFIISITQLQKVYGLKSFVSVYPYMNLVVLFLLVLSCICVLKNVSLEYFFYHCLSDTDILVDTCWWCHSKWVWDQPKAKTKNWFKGIFWSKNSLLSCCHAYNTINWFIMFSQLDFLQALMNSRFIWIYLQ